MDVRIELRDNGGMRVLERLAALMNDTTPLTRQVSEALRQSTEKGIAAEVDPATGRAWAPLAASTLRRRAKTGQGSGHQTDALFRSLNVGCSRESAWIGSTLPQAVTQQFGARRGAFGRLPNGRPLPWGDIPARPFLGLSPDTENAISVGILQHILTGDVAL